MNASTRARSADPLRSAPRPRARRDDARIGRADRRRDRRPLEIDDDRVHRVRSGLFDPRPIDLLEMHVVLVTADDDWKTGLFIRLRESVIVVDRLVRQRDHARAPLGHQAHRFASRRFVR